MPGRVQGKVAIVTGAGSVGEGIGNGKAAAIVYAREGAKLLLVDYRLDAAEETKAIVDKEGGECSTLQADVGRSEECGKIIQSCVERYGRVDILHNNAGV